MGASSSVCCSRDAQHPLSLLNGLAGLGSDIPERQTRQNEHKSKQASKQTDGQTGCLLRPISRSVVDPSVRSIARAFVSQACILACPLPSPRLMTANGRRVGFLKCGVGVPPTPTGTLIRIH